MKKLIIILALLLAMSVSLIHAEEATSVKV